MDFLRSMRQSRSSRLVVVAITVFLALIIYVLNDPTIGAIPSVHAIKDFFGSDDAAFKNILLFISIPVLIVLGILAMIKSRRINKLKTGEIPTKEITGKVQSIEYETGGKNDSGKIVRWYYTAEGINPFTNEPYVFTSEEYPYPNQHPRKIRFSLFGISKADKEEFDEYTSQYLKIGDSVKIFVSQEKADDYYLQDIVKDKAVEIASLSGKPPSKDKGIISSWSFTTLIKVVGLSLLLLIVLGIMGFLFVGGDMSPTNLLVLVVLMGGLIWGIVFVVRSARDKEDDPRLTHGM